MTIERVGVVGAGQMGAGIAEVSLRKAGADVDRLRAHRGSSPTRAATRITAVARAGGGSKGKLQPKPIATRRSRG